MNILKFGGTSMGDDQTWQQVLNIIDGYAQPCVVVSATARTTRQLMAAAENSLDDFTEAQAISADIRDRHLKIIQNFLNNYPKAEPAVEKECKSWINKRIADLDTLLRQVNETQELTLKTKDAIASIGERLSSYLFAKCGRVAGLPTTWVDAADIIQTNADYGQASPQIAKIEENAHLLAEKLTDGRIPVIGGYYGQDEQGHTTTLGFEGSDYTASLIGAVLSADTIEIWTDVSGIYTCDPRVVEDARPIPQLSFQEATELAYFGAKVLHPSTTKPASQKQIPVRVKNIFNPQAYGTSITHELADNGPVKAMTFKENCTVITVSSSQTVMGYEFLASVFDILRWHHLAVDVVTTTEASVSIAIEKNNRITEAIEQLESYGSVETAANQGIISLVGCRQNGSKSLVNNILSCINRTPANLISFSQSKGNLNIVMDRDHIISSVKTIHQHLF